jgi:CRP-like cAMP-binding protein
MSYEYSPVELGPIQQMHALRRLFGIDSGYSNEALAAISRLTSAQRVPAGQQLAREGEPFERVFLIVDGLLEITHHGIALGQFGPGEAVGVLSALGRDREAWGCSTLADSTLLTLRTSEIFEVFEDHFELMHGALVKLAADAIMWRRKLAPNAGFSADLRTPCLACGRGPLNLVERTLHLRHTIGLEDSYIDELTELARAATEVRLAAGTRLWSSGDLASNALVVVSGVVEARTPEGTRFRFGPGDMLGNLDTIAGVPRWFDAWVERDLVGLSLDGEAIVDVWEDHPAMGFAFLRMLSQLVVSLRLQAARASRTARADSPEGDRPSGPPQPTASHA